MSVFCDKTLTKWSLARRNTVTFISQFPCATTLNFAVTLAAAAETPAAWRSARADTVQPCCTVVQQVCLNFLFPLPEVNAVWPINNQRKQCCSRTGTGAGQHWWPLSRILCARQFIHVYQCYTLDHRMPNAEAEVVMWVWISLFLSLL